MTVNAASRVAFFDVDETLIATKSMFAFLAHYLRAQGEPGSTYERLTGELHQAAAAGTPRHEINRRYYQLYKGRSVASLAAAGRDWFEDSLDGLFLDQPLSHLEAHRDAGTPVVLLSGSFFACLDPVAEHTGATWAIGTRPLMRRGELTGDVLVPMIGDRKGRAANAVAGVLGVSLKESYAYGDHASDLALLSCVGNPHVIGDDPVLKAEAEQHGWPRLSDTPRPTIPEPVYAAQQPGPAPMST
ncbi:HAD family hydrolase [Streptomyces sp.]|uniref:HAD family hydrolase n=1 Tax=Streptomyces sp. TaxID=1931 RepID=UPI002F3EF127